jgi:hypothetical protein
MERDLAKQDGAATQDKEAVVPEKEKVAQELGEGMVEQNTKANRSYDLGGSISIFESDDDEEAASSDIFGNRKDELDAAVAHHIKGFTRKKNKQTRTKRVGAASASRPKHEPTAQVCPCCTPEWLLSHEEIEQLARISGEEAAIAQGGGDSGMGGQEGEFDGGGDDGEELSMSERRRQGRTDGLVLYG